MPRYAVIPMVGLLMALVPGTVRAAEASASAVGTYSTPLPRTSTAARARQLLNAGQPDQAKRLVSAALDAGGSDDSLLCVWGEIHFPSRRLRRSRARL